MSDLKRLLFRQAGVLTRQQALVHFTASAVHRRVRSGTWDRPAPGVYVVDRSTDEVERLRWIAVLSAPAGAAIAGRTALTQLGLRGFDSWAVHVLIPHSLRSPARRHRTIFHRTRHLSSADVRTAAGPPCSKPGRALLDAAQWARSDREAITLIAATFQQRLVSEAELRQALARVPRVHRRAVIEHAIDDAVSGAHSLPEMEFLRLCRRGGLPTPVLQASRLDRAGRRRYVDAYFAAYRIIAEIDGQQHIEVRAWWEDMQRQNSLQVAGERVLRFPAWVIRHHPDEVLDTIRRALREAGWQE